MENHIIDSTSGSEALMARMPADLRQLYSESEGFVTPLGVTVYGYTDVLERNDTYEIAEYCPGFLLIGDDSGGRGFLVALDSTETLVFSSGLGDLAVAGFVREAESLTEWLSLIRQPGS